VRDASERALTQGSGAIIPLWKAVKEKQLSMPEVRIYKMIEVCQLMPLASSNAR
jgi:hypothetical protein